MFLWLYSRVAAGLVPVSGVLFFLSAGSEHSDNKNIDCTPAMWSPATGGQGRPVDRIKIGVLKETEEFLKL